MSLGYFETLATLKADGTALTAAARASATQGAAATGARYTMPGGKVRIGDYLFVLAGGRVSSVVTTPGTFRLDLSFGGTANFDTLAIALNTTAQTTVPWSLLVWGRVTEIGTAATIFWQGLVSSTAFINTAAVATGPYTGGITVPFNTAPVIGPTFDATVSQLVDLQFTQTAATGSFTLHTYLFGLMSSSGY